MTDDRIAGVRRYFTVTPVRPAPRRTDNERIMLLVGGVLVLVGLILMIASTLIGVFLIISGVALAGVAQQRIKDAEGRNAIAERDYKTLLRAAEPKPDDEQMDRWLDESLRRAVDVGWRELGLKGLAGIGTAELQIVGIPRYTTGLLGRIGRDGKVRLNTYEITVLYLTDRKLCAFQGVLSMASGGLRQVTTHEFYRQHISTLATERSLTAISLFRNSAAESQMVQTRRLTIGASTATISTDFGVSTPASPDGLDWMSGPALRAVEELRQQLDWSAGRDLS